MLSTVLLEEVHNLRSFGRTRVNNILELGSVFIQLTKDKKLTADYREITDLLSGLNDQLNLFEQSLMQIGTPEDRYLRLKSHFFVTRQEYVRYIDKKAERWGNRLRAPQLTKFMSALQNLELSDHRGNSDPAALGKYKAFRLRYNEFEQFLHKTLRRNKPGTKSIILIWQEM